MAKDASMHEEHAPPDTTSNQLPLGLSESCSYADDSQLLEKLRALEREDLSKIEARFAFDRQCSSSLAAAAKKEFLRHFALKHLTREPLSPNVAADEFWHTLLLHTKLYREFCQRHFGLFIDHEPSKINQEPRASLHARMTLYEECFGKTPDEVSNHVEQLRHNPTLKQRLERAQTHLRSFLPNGGPSLEDRAPQTDAFTKWGDWDNSWKNWGQWKEWSQWGNWDMCS
jgi:hypothetical protein